MQGRAATPPTTTHLRLSNLSIQRRQRRLCSAPLTLLCRGSPGQLVGLALGCRLGGVLDFGALRQARLGVGGRQEKEERQQAHSLAGWHAGKCGCMGNNLKVVGKLQQQQQLQL